MNTLGNGDNEETGWKQTNAHNTTEQGEFTDLIVDALELVA